MSRLDDAMDALQSSDHLDVEEHEVDLTGGAEPIDCISTGSIVLNYMIGGNKLDNGQRQCPGIPRGKITELYGSESSGKCFSKGTYVQSEYGMLTIEELFEKEDDPTCITDKIEEHEVDLLNEHGDMESTSHFTWNGRKDVLDITNEHGMSMEVTENHPLRVINEHGYIVWRRAENIREGDHLVMRRGDASFPETSSLNEDEARWIGYMVADGMLNSDERVAFSNSNEDVVEDYTSLSRSIYEDVSGDSGNIDILSYEKEGSNTVDHHINSTSMREYVQDEFGLDQVTAADKEVPLCVREGTRDVQEAFLRSYIELECHLHVDKRYIEIASASRDLLEQVQLMLLNLGYVSRVRPKEVDGTTYWRLTMRGRDAIKYGQEVGFISSKRKSTFDKFETSNFNTNTDSVPNISGVLQTIYDSIGDTDRSDSSLFSHCINGGVNVTYDRLQKIVDQCEGRLDRNEALFNHLRSLLDERFVFSEVKNIDMREGVPTFDVCMPQTHSFWSNGMISHNTTVALETATKVHEEGGSVCYLDYENAIEPAYAEQIGVEIDRPEKFRLVQPPHWEAGAEAIIRMIKANVDLVVVDSIAAMKPKVAVEDNDVSDTGQIGHLARKMSQYLPKIVNPLKKSDTALLFINQLRSKINTNPYSGGPDEETTGGRALKYYYSLRIKLNNTKTDREKVENELTGEEEKVSVATHVYAKVTKSKVSRHQGRRAHFIIRYGEGIDNIQSAIDIASNKGIIEQNGAWYSFIGVDGEEVKCHGKQDLRDHLVNNQDDLNYVLKEVQNSFSEDEDPGQVSSDDSDGPDDDVEVIDSE